MNFELVFLIGFGYILFVAAKWHFQDIKKDKEL